MTHTDSEFDVVVIGGGAAGLAGALSLGRSRRSVLVVDAGRQRNLPAEGIHAFLTRDGTPPADFLAAARAEARSYGAALRTGEAVSARRDGDRFVVTLADGAVVTGRRLLVTTGLADVLPDVPGVAERWGRDVVHCPYCHGYEVRDRALGVLSTGPMTAHQALLFRQLSDDVVVFAHTGPPPTPLDRARLDARGVRVVAGAVTGLEVAGDAITGVRLAGGRVVARDVLVVATRVVAGGDLLAGLGVRTAPHPMAAELGEYVPALDPTGRTDVPGVWVAGNVADLAAQVIAAAAQGNAAGAAINADLVLADADAAADAPVSSVARP